MLSLRQKCSNLDYFVSVDFLRLKSQKIPVILTVTNVKQPGVVHVAAIDISKELDMNCYLKRKWYIKQYMCDKELFVKLKLEDVESYLKSFQIGMRGISIGTEGEEQRHFFAQYSEVLNIEYAFKKQFTVFDCRSCYVRYWVDCIVELKKQMSN